MTTTYLPTTIDDLSDLLDSGLLREGHYTDFKRELARNGNKGFAKDIAAFAVDGGHIYIGVEEDKTTGQASVYLVPLEGLKERVDQIAGTAVRPPVQVRCIELPSKTNPGEGCLIVEVRPSPNAPHQAVERFWGRSDTTNYVLSPSEIDTLYERRVGRNEQLEELLDIEIARDPTPATMREFAHIFVVAQPLKGDTQMLYDAVGEGGLLRWMSGAFIPSLSHSNCAPDLPICSGLSPRAGGVAKHDFEITPERKIRLNSNPPPREHNLYDFELREDGGVRLFNGRGSDAHSSSNSKILLEAITEASVGRVVECATAVANETSYLGHWFVGVAITNLAGVVSHDRVRAFLDDPTGYSADEYRGSATFSFEDIEAREPVLDRLLGPLLRGLGSSYQFTTIHNVDE